MSTSTGPLGDPVPGANVTAGTRLRHGREATAVSEADEEAAEGAALAHHGVLAPSEAAAAGVLSPGQGLGKSGYPSLAGSAWGAGAGSSSTSPFATRSSSSA